MGHQPENEPRGVDALGSRAAILRHRLAKEIQRGKMPSAEAHGRAGIAKPLRRPERRIEGH